LGAQIAPNLEPGENLVSSALYFVYDYPAAQPDQSLSIQERDTLIRARYASGVSQADLARQFGISYQRVHQIVRGEMR
jgi:DNA-binding MarR family transcriptional regulator